MPLLAAVAIDAAIRWFGHRRDPADAPIPEPEPEAPAALPTGAPAP
jgi:hypothetical protein